MIHLISISLGINNLKVDRKILITIISKNSFILKEIKSVSGNKNKEEISPLKRIGCLVGSEMCIRDSLIDISLGINNF